MSYALFIRDIALDAAIGLHDFEKAARQRVLVSVTVIVAERSIADTAESVFDYDKLVAFIRALGTRPHTLLQETICREIVRFCEADTEILGGVVQTQKPDVYPDARTVGCRMAWGEAPAPALLVDP